MAKLYRIEIDVLLDDGLRSKVIQAAREHYRKIGGMWTVEGDQTVPMTAEELVVDTKTAFLEIADSAFRTVIPDIEPQAMRCGIERDIEVKPILRLGRSCRPRRIPR